MLIFSEDKLDSLLTGIILLTPLTLKDSICFAKRTFVKSLRDWRETFFNAKNSMNSASFETDLRRGGKVVALGVELTLIRFPIRWSCESLLISPPWLLGISHGMRNMRQEAAVQVPPHM